jgi:hypothetical protein
MANADRAYFDQNFAGSRLLKVDFLDPERLPRSMEDGGTNLHRLTLPLPMPPKDWGGRTPLEFPTRSV